MKKANITMKEFYSDEKERMRYDALFMFECDKATMRRVGLEEGLEKGRAEGMEKGRAEGMEEAARNMLKEGTPIEAIIRWTGLPIEKIEKLKGK